MPELKAGEPIAELRVTPDKYTPHRYAGASGDFNPIHIDDEFAKAVGLPRTILHGLWSMSQFANAVQQAAGDDPTKIRRLSAQFRGMGFPEQEVVVTGSVTGVDGSTATIECEAAQGDNKIIRNAVAEVDVS